MSTVEREVPTSDNPKSSDLAESTNRANTAHSIEQSRSETLPSKKRKRNPLVRFSLMLIRRSHLYFGLLLAPWALLYGVTAYLFNHPTHFSASRSETLAASKDIDSWPTSNWHAGERAQLVLAELNQRFSEDRNEPIELLDSPKPSFDSDYISASFEVDDENYFVSAPIDGSPGRIRIFPKRNREPEVETASFQIQPKSKNQRGRGGQSSRPASDSSESPNAPQNPELAPGEQPLMLEETLAESIKEMLIARVKFQYPDIDLDPSSLNLRSVPKLRFHARADGREWISDYDALSGAVSTRDAEVAVKPDWRRFLLRLHVAHGYPIDGGVRWIWAVVVDVMAAVMVFWGLSGIVMWWQIKSTRRWGTVAMAISLAMAVTLGVGMFQMLHAV